MKCVLNCIKTSLSKLSLDAIGTVQEYILHEKNHVIDRRYRCQHRWENQHNSRKNRVSRILRRQLRIPLNGSEQLDLLVAGSFRIYYQMGLAEGPPATKRFSEGANSLEETSVSWKANCLIIKYTDVESSERVPQQQRQMRTTTFCGEHVAIYAYGYVSGKQPGLISAQTFIQYCLFIC